MPIIPLTISGAFSKAACIVALSCNLVAAESQIALSPEEETLAKQWTGLVRTLERHIKDELPVVDKEANSKYRDARKGIEAALSELAVAQKEAAETGISEELVIHARHKWIAGAEKGISASKKKLREARTKDESEIAKKELVKWMQNKREGMKALKERQATLADARNKEPARNQRLENARHEYSVEQSKMLGVIGGLGLEPVLKNQKLDGKLAKLFVIKHGTPARLAKFALSKDGNRELLERLFRDEKLLVEMAVADGASDGRYGDALRIYSKILEREDAEAARGHLGRLALAVALEHAKPITQRTSGNKSSKTIDPVQRYQHYRNADQAGELDSGFRNLTVWEYRFVVGGDEPDEMLQWGRDMLRNYRPDLISGPEERWRYVQIVRSDIRWGTEDYKHDRGGLQLVQNILMNGGTCGRRAVMGRFILRAFGVPTTARPQKGHASLVRRTSSGWVPCLGGGWGTGWTKTRYGDDLNFLASTQARALGVPFMQVMRGHWIGGAMGEPRTWGLVGGRPDFWNGIALYTQRRLLDQPSAIHQKAPSVDEMAAPAANEQFLISEVDRAITFSNGVITIRAAATTIPAKGNDKILFMKSIQGGSQMHYSRDGNAQDFEYQFDMNAAGSYNLVAEVVTPSWGQGLMIGVNDAEAARIELPCTMGAWESTAPVTVSLHAGRNFLRFSPVSEGFAKGFTIKEILLSPR